jgi:nitrilase
MGLVTVGAVQAAPVFLDRDETVEKACALVCEAGRAGAQLVAFPEAFVAGFPHWIYLDRPQANEDYFVQLVREAVDVPSAATEALGQAAKEAGAHVVIGINEGSRRSAGEFTAISRAFSPVVSEVAAGVQLDPDGKEARWIRTT